MRAIQSLLSWERGLKCAYLEIILRKIIVAPLVGAWIEISLTCCVSLSSSVAPLVGAWIEMQEDIDDVKKMLSLLSWERGLK